MYSSRGKLAAGVIVLTLILALVAGCGTPTPAPTVAPTKAPAAPTAAPTTAPTKAPTSAAADFYKGKVLNVIVPYSAGGGFDQYARLIQPALEAAMPGTAVVVQNFTGAGGVVGTNQVYRAAPDGLTVGIAAVAGMAFAAAVGQEGVQYDLGKVSWIGRINADPRVVVVSAKGGIKSVADLKKLNRPVLAAATGVGSDDYYMSILLLKALGLPYKIASGYTGSSEADLGVLRGETDLEVISLTGIRAGIDSGDFLPILFIAGAPVAGFEKVPLAKDQDISADNKALVEAALAAFDLERAYIGPPGIPADRLEYLRAAFNKVHTDKATIEILTKAKRPVNWLDGKTCEGKIATVVANSKLISAAVKAP